MAQKLKDLTQSSQVRLEVADDSRTANIASVPEPLGTQFKHEPNGIVVELEKQGKRQVQTFHTDWRCTSTFL